MRGCGYGLALEDLDPADRKEVRMYQRFLKLWPKYEKEMLQRDFWREYLGLPLLGGTGKSSCDATDGTIPVVK